MRKVAQSLKKRIVRRLARSDVPLIVYAAMALTMVLVWSARSRFPDLSLNLVSELLGAAFTLFIIDTLLVRSKTRRWRIVADQIDYLIARTTFRLRDGLATRAFGFVPQIDGGRSRAESAAGIREQRARFFEALARASEAELEARLDHQELFSDRMYAYLDEKAADVWAILNMKYSEYLEPELVSMLMGLHGCLKDTAANIRQYRKSERVSEPDDQAYYRELGVRGAVLSLKGAIEQLIALKEAGYSAPAATAR